MKSPATDCPRFSHCSVNNCPLEPRYPDILTHPDDKEKSCPMEKGVRIRISKAYPGILKMDGMTTREWVAKARYDALSPAVKSQMAEEGRLRLKILRASKQG